MRTGALRGILYRWMGCGLLVVVLGLVPWRCGAVEVDLQPDGRVDLDARSARMGSVLQALGREFGMEIWLDPEVAEYPVDLDVQGRSPQELFRELLSPLGYAVEWQRLSTEERPRVLRHLEWNGAWIKRIQVFRPGHRAEARLFFGGREVVELTLPDGRKVLVIKGEMLIRLNPDTDARLAIGWLLANGFQVLSHHSGMGTMLVSAGSMDLDAAKTLLSGSGLFRYDEPHFVTSTPREVTGTLIGTSYGAEAWMSPEAAAALSSQSRGVQVAILDSGLNPIPGLGDRVVGGFDFIDQDTTPQDTLGHGTSMAAIVGDLYGEQQRESGIENQVGLVPVRVLSDEGLTDYWTLSQALWNVGESSAQIINLSLSGTVSSELLHEAVLHAYENGKIIIASAGNDGVNEANYPAAYPEVIGVGGVDPRTGEVAGYSNYGDWVDVAYTGQGMVPGTDSTMVSFGTSAAAARLSSTVALLLASEPGLSYEQVVERLRAASTPATAPDGSAVSSMGVLDGERLLGGKD